MPKKHGNSIQNDKKYEALRDKGYSKERAAKITNATENDANEKKGKKKK